MYKPTSAMNINTIKQLFPSFEEELYQEIVEQGAIKKVKAGEVMLRAGQTIRSTMLIIEGIVKLYREDDEGKEFFIYHLDAGEACSLSMVCAARHEKSEVLAKALTDATVLAIPLACMEEWMSKYKSWYQFVITSYRNRFEELLKTIDAIAFSNMDERLENYVRKQVEKMGTNLKITHQQIANDPQFIAGSHQPVALKKWKQTISSSFIAILLNGLKNNYCSVTNITNRVKI